MCCKPSGTRAASRSAQGLCATFTVGTRTGGGGMTTGGGTGSAVSAARSVSSTFSAASIARRSAAILSSRAWDGISFLVYCFVSGCLLALCEGGLRERAQFVQRAAVLDERHNGRFVVVRKVAGHARHQQITRHVLRCRLVERGENGSPLTLKRRRPRRAADILDGLLDPFSQPLVRRHRSPPVCSAWAARAASYMPNQTCVAHPREKPSTALYIASVGSRATP